jgi:L-fuconolactonase
MIVDSHHHFWRVDRGDYHWMSPVLGVLHRDYLPDDLRPIIRRAGVDGTIVVQAAQTEAETDFMLALAAECDFVLGVVGWLDFEDGEFPRKLEALMQRPKFVGLRPMLQDIQDDAYILRPAVLENLRRVASFDLPFEFLTYPRHLPHVIRALDKTPNLRAVVDHVSKPRIADQKTDGWAQDMARIAEHDKVWCKLSGMVTEANHTAWRPADLKPFVQHVFDTFGEDRVMFGSDWPVCLLAASYAEVLNALRTILDNQLSDDGMAMVFGGNAIQFYKLKV